MAVMHEARRPGRSALAFLNDATFRAIAYQVLVAAALVLCAWYLVNNTATNMAERGLTAGFGFLDSSAGFGIGFTLIEYQEGDTYWRVFQVGMANTLLV
ncbi:MAG: amino acid ABC transporter permease, partial [Pseudomonadota bacterium]